MRKVFFILILNFILICNVDALDKVDANIISCDTSDEYVVSINNKFQRIRLLNFTRDDTDINKVIDEYTCNKVMKSKNIKVSLTGKKDKYNFLYAILYVDNKDIREELISLGYGQVSNVESYSNELDNLCLLEKDAITNKLGIWKYVEKEDFCKNNIVNNIEVNDITEEKNMDREVNQYNITILFILTIFILFLSLCIIKKRG